MNIRTMNPEDPVEFDEVYMTYFPGLNKYAYVILKDRAVAEDMVHNVFMKVIQNSKTFAEATNQKGYLFRAVYNECMNYVRAEQVKSDYKENRRETDLSNDAVHYKELTQEVLKALDSLPEQCRRVFQMSRYEELRYKEIALQLGITVSTVEKHMMKALKRLKIQLEDYLPLLFILLLT